MNVKGKIITAAAFEMSEDKKFKIISFAIIVMAFLGLILIVKYLGGR